MSFRTLHPGVHVAGQISVEDLDAAAALGIRHIVSNRPDGEEPGQIDTAVLAEAASERGLNFIHAPARGLPGPEVVDAVEAVLATGEPVLLFCRSGMRSTAAWGMASARSGRLDRDQIVEAAAAAGYDLGALPLD